MQNNNCNGSGALLARALMALCAIMLAMGGASMVSRAEAAPFAYVANETFLGPTGVAIAVIDTATNKLVAKVAVPDAVGNPCVAVTPDGKHVYVAGLNTVSVIDTVTNTLVAVVTVGNGPCGFAVTLDGKHAYVPNTGSNNVSVIDTVTNTVVAVVPGGFVAVNPDGKHAYVANYFSNNVSVIDTVTNKVVATVPVGTGPAGVAVTPDGKHAYVPNTGSNNVSVIDTVTNTVAAVVPGVAGGVTVNPDGKHVYVTKAFGDPGTVSVIATATNKVVATIPVGPAFEFVEVAVTPDGKQVYVSNFESQDVSVIDTATNTLVATVPTQDPNGIAVTPDGKHVYVPDYASGGVSVIDTATNKVVAFVPVGPLGSETSSVVIVPPPSGVPFLAFSATLAIDVDAPKHDAFNLQSHFTLSSTAPAIRPHVEPVTLQVGTFTVTISPGSFKKQLDGSFTFAGTIGGVSLQASINPTGTLRYAFNASATGASLIGTKNEVYVTLKIGNDSGVTSVTATITH